MWHVHWRSGDGVRGSWWSRSNEQLTPLFLPPRFWNCYFTITFFQRLLRLQGVVLMARLWGTPPDLLSGFLPQVILFPAGLCQKWRSNKMAVLDSPLLPSPRPKVWIWSAKMEQMADFLVGGFPIYTLFVGKTCQFCCFCAETKAPSNIKVVLWCHLL